MKDLLQRILEDPHREISIFFSQTEETLRGITTLNSIYKYYAFMATVQPEYSSAGMRGYSSCPEYSKFLYPQLIIQHLTTLYEVFTEWNHRGSFEAGITIPSWSWRIPAAPRIAHSTNRINISVLSPEKLLLTLQAANWVGYKSGHNLVIKTWGSEGK